MENMLPNTDGMVIFCYVYNEMKTTKPCLINLYSLIKEIRSFKTLFGVVFIYRFRLFCPSHIEC